MNVWQRRLLWSSTVVVTASGLLYAVLRYLVTPVDPFSAYHHPLQPWALDAHVLLAPVLLFALGWFWGNHVLPKLSRKVPRRPSGLALIGLILVMTVSGYLLQVSTIPLARALLGWLHGLSGTAYVAFLVAHAFLRTAPEAGPPHFGSARPAEPAARGRNTSAGAAGTRSANSYRARPRSSIGRTEEERA